MNAEKKSGKTVKIRQTGSPSRRPHTQRETLVGLKLNKIGRVAELVDTPQTRGMIAKVAHLVEVVEKEQHRRQARAGHPRVTAVDEPKAE